MAEQNIKFTQTWYDQNPTWYLSISEFENFVVTEIDINVLNNMLCDIFNKYTTQFLLTNIQHIIKIFTCQKDEALAHILHFYCYRNDKYFFNEKGRIICIALLKEGANINQIHQLCEDKYLLHYVISKFFTIYTVYGDHDFYKLIPQLLMVSKPDIIMKCFKIFTFDDCDSPLRHSSHFTHIIHLMIYHILDVNIIPSYSRHNETFLMHCMKYLNLKLIMYLHKEKKANISARDKNGWSVLRHALKHVDNINRKNHDMIEYILTNLNIYDSNGLIDIYALKRGFYLMYFNKPLQSLFKKYLDMTYMVEGRMAFIRLIDGCSHTEQSDTGLSYFRKLCISQEICTFMLPISSLEQDEKKEFEKKLIQVGMSWYGKT